MKQLKRSRQREALIELLCSVKTHPSAEWLYTELKKQIPNISLATVYRNLNLLREEGMVIKLDTGCGTDHFDRNVAPHYHFVCKECRSIVDIALPVLDELNTAAEQSLSAVVDEHSLIFYGICGNCRKN